MRYNEWCDRNKSKRYEEKESDIEEKLRSQWIKIFKNNIIKQNEHEHISIRVLNFMSY